ncbi:hypothetical protein BU24DRAFT_421133 [Aaosphaeria arxii CBS 175.79]|uniref:Uncharacterized protein n=1 Tax=Aaosphaeria arxii CBS 175.79 TaxID=1450172 RepID=A0A6A5XY95_9PLEO|nr:uncharacterized protein BU24DRAFT_421133 [Aaosphaeria arxii CBS 175.79]KAF2018132.1 hypothetical protein BU24DRAFT_421133 [Aaosphaeria arxii CBS 175.79]
MATAEPASRPHDRHTHKRPFGWIKRLANLKSSTSDSPHSSGKKAQGSPSKSKKGAGKNNNPYPESGHLNTTNANTSSPGNGHLSFSTSVSPHSNESFTSVEERNTDCQQTVDKSNKSTAPTVATNVETVHSGRSKTTGHSNNLGGGGSTFSSPSHSERSLTTTLTTIQSTAPANVLAQTQQNTQANAPPVHFSHQFPTSPPPSAIPPHLTAQPQPSSYQAATANNILTDNASILTLASSSKRRRRNSLDTNASVRALAPSSVWGGSRESLPLSVLSANPESSTIYSPQNRSGVAGFANAERASVYSSQGVVAPVLGSERNSYYAGKQADALSVRSGLLGHGRTDSINGSIHATPSSPLASPRDPVGPGILSRRSSDWKDAAEAHAAADDRDSPSSPALSKKEEKDKPV